MAQTYMEDNLLIFIKITNPFINKVWDVCIMEHYVTLKEDEAAPCVVIWKDGL